MRKAKWLLLGLSVLTPAAAVGAEVAQWEVFEASYQSQKTYANPFIDIEVDVVFRQGEKQWIVPAFWAGGGKWSVRFAPPAQGEYTYRVECTDKANTGLNGSAQTLSVIAYKGQNDLLKHGFLTISSDRRHFMHSDGTPFFWLGDTWWKGLCKRLTWEGFQELTANRKTKGFTVVQIVCGTYPDEGAFESRWENEGGKPYETKDFSVVNPTYFEFADRRIKHLVDAGIVPAIVGGWGRSDCDAMRTAGVDGIKRHWRNLVARYGAYPTVWIVGGEVDDETIPRSTASAYAKWGQGPWGEVAKYLRRIDPYHHPLTFHTTYGRRGWSNDETVIDFDMVTGSHDGWNAASKTSLALLTDAVALSPPMPVLSGETAYEGHMQNNLQDVQRHVFWMLMLSGAAGHTYGAAGVWHASVDGDPGITPVYDLTTWREGMNYPGSTQLGLGKKLLEEYPWSQFMPHPEWVEPGSFAAGIPGKVRFIYQPRRGMYSWAGPLVKDLEREVPYHAFYFNPTNGRRFDLGTVKRHAMEPAPGAAGADEFRAPNLPSPQDWVLVLERINS